MKRPSITPSDLALRPGGRGFIAPALLLSGLCLGLVRPSLAQQVAPVPTQPAAPATVPAEAPVAGDEALDSARTRLAAPLMSQPLIGQQPLVPLMPLMPAGEAGLLPGRSAGLRLAAGVVHDSNVDRTTQARSDRIGQFTAGLRVDKRLGLQRFTLDAEATALRFDREGARDHDLANYRGAWDFAFTPRLRGTVSARQAQLRDFSQVDSLTPRVDLRTEREQAADLRFEPAARWRVEGGIASLRSRSGAERSLESNARIESVRAGLGHRWPSGLDLLVQVRRGDGSYPGQVAPDFRDTQADLVLRVPLRAAWTLDARAGQLRRRHESQPARDFDGAVGAANLGWAVTGRTRVDAGLERVLGGYDIGGGGHVRASRAYLAPTWQAGAHTAVSLRHAQESRRWTTVDPSSTDAGREDRSYSAGLVLDWQPRRSWQMLAQVRNERRDSSLPGADFRATVSSLTLRINL